MPKGIVIKTLNRLVSTARLLRNVSQLFGCERTMCVFLTMSAANENGISWVLRPCSFAASSADGSGNGTILMIIPCDIGNGEENANRREKDERLTQRLGISGHEITSIGFSERTCGMKGTSPFITYFRRTKPGSFPAGYPARPARAAFPQRPIRSSLLRTNLRLRGIPVRPCALLRWKSPRSGPGRGLR